MRRVFFINLVFLEYTQEKGRNFIYVCDEEFSSKELKSKIEKELGCKILITEAIELAPKGELYQFKSVSLGIL